MRRISILLIIAVVLSALVLPGLAYAKRPLSNPGKGLGLSREESGSASADTRGKGKKKGQRKFELEGIVTVVSREVSGTAVGTFKVKILGGNFKRIGSTKGSESPEIKVTDSTVFKSKGKTASFANLAVDQRVHVKGKIEDGTFVKGHFEGTFTLTATRVVIKPKPGKP